MCLELVFSIHVFSDPVCEGLVDCIPLVDHGSRTLVEQLFNSVAHIFGGSPLCLRTLDVVVTELSPALRNRLTGRGSIQKRLAQAECKIHCW